MSNFCLLCLNLLCLKSCVENFSDKARDFQIFDLSTIFLEIFHDNYPAKSHIKGLIEMKNCLKLNFMFGSSKFHFKKVTLFKKINVLKP